MRFTRHPSAQALELLFHTEVYIYTNFHMIPYLRSLFSNGDSMFIWVRWVMGDGLWVLSFGQLFLKAVSYFYFSLFLPFLPLIARFRDGIQKTHSA